MFDTIVLLSAAFFAGVINSVAGGGSFLTFPALVYVGVPVIPANATSTVVVFPGYISGMFGFLKELKAFDRRQFVVMVLLAALGGVLGALLLLVTPSDVFSTVVPWLLLFATLLFAMGDKIADYLHKRKDNNPDKGWVATLFVSIYGGYFNGGLGIVLLALFSTLGLKDIKLMSGLKNCLSTILSFSSVMTFTVAGVIYWKQAFLMMIAATVGGYGGALLVRVLPPNSVRVLVVVIGLAMTIGFFLK